VVFRKKDLTHSASAKLPEDVVMADLSGWQQ
jgi:hypothetical protein